VQGGRIYVLDRSVQRWRTEIAGFRTLGDAAPAVRRTSKGIQTVEGGDGRPPKRENPFTEDPVRHSSKSLKATGKQCPEGSMEFSMLEIHATHQQSST